MANEHPFQSLFETLGRAPAAHAESVNRQAYETLHDILSVPVEKEGRCILLRAPRAGHGKTHLLSRIQHHLGTSHEFIPLHASFGSEINAASVIDDTLRRLLRQLPASGGLCELDLVTRRLFATALQPLVGSGEVPCQDREGALTALRTRPVETFDFHHPNAVTAHWARENFEVLGQRLSVEIALRCDLPVREVAFWVDALFRFAATSVDNPNRIRVLVEAIHGENVSEGVPMERLEALLGMLAQLMRVVLVADDLEGFSSDESAALRLAAFIGSLRQSVERLDVILSLNQDIWESAFVPRLSGGLTDRLSEVVIELEPLSEDEMIALLESRVPGLGARVMGRVDRAEAGTHARGLIRAAGVAWLRASAMDAKSSAPTTPVVAPVSLVSPPKEVARPDPPAAPAVVEKPVDVPVIPETSIFEAAPQPVEDFPVQDSEPLVAPEPEPEVGPPPVPAKKELSAVFTEPVDFSQEEPVPAPVFETASEEAVEDVAPEVVPEPEMEDFSKASPFEADLDVNAPPVIPDPMPEPPADFASAMEESDDPAPSEESGDDEASAPDTDRVDDLLQQFRDRYGRGSM